MTLKDTDVMKIAYLASLGLNRVSLQKIKEDLNNMLQVVEEIKDIDTENIEPLTYPVDTSLILRSDTVVQNSHQDDYQLVAPAIKQKFFTIPKVIE